MRLFRCDRLFINAFCISKKVLSKWYYYTKIKFAALIDQTDFISVFHQAHRVVDADLFHDIHAVITDCIFT